MKGTPGIPQIKCDICLLQETHLRRADWARLRSRWFDCQFFSSLPGKKAGVAVLFATHFPGRILGVQTEIPGRVLALRVAVGSYTYTLASLYGPNEGQEGFLRDAISLILEDSSENLIIGGDYNIVQDPTLDRTTQRTGHLGALSASMRGWLVEVGLADALRQRNPTAHDYTFFSAVHQFYTRLDFCFSSPHH